VESSFARRVKALGLPLDQVIVIGSGVLAEHEIRQARDVDLVVPKSLFAKLEQDAMWKRGFQGSASYALEKGDVEVWTDWSTDGTGHPTYEDLLKVSELIDGIRFITLEYLEKRKLERGTEKDLLDVRKIHEYKEKL